jgi:heme O synthase-like polyprenyltransferase
MAYYMDLLFKSYLFWIVVIMLSFLLLIFISSIIKSYVGDVYKLVLLIYAIYFPIGAFMGEYYLITTKQWVPRGNLFTISFLYITILMILLIAGKYLTKCLSKKSEYEINKVEKYMLLGDRITK